MKRFYYDGDIVNEEFDKELFFIENDGNKEKFIKSDNYALFSFELNYLRESIRTKKECCELGFIYDKFGNHRLFTFSETHGTIFRDKKDGNIWVHESLRGFFACFDDLDIISKINVIIIRTRFSNEIDLLSIANVIFVFDNAVIFEKDKIKYIIYVD